MPDLYMAISDWFEDRLEFMPCDDDLELHDALVMAAHAVQAAIDTHPTKAILDAIAKQLGIGETPLVIDGEAVPDA